MKYMTQFDTTMSTTAQTQYVLQVGQEWFSRPLAFISMESGDLYVHFQLSITNIGITGAST